jgi:hypothetical protein
MYCNNYLTTIRQSIYNEGYLLNYGTIYLYIILGDRSGAHGVDPWRSLADGV